MSIFAKKNALRRRHNERNGVSNHQPHDCLFNRLSTVYSGGDKKQTSKLRVIGLCEGNSPVTGKCVHLMTSSWHNNAFTFITIAIFWFQFHWYMFSRAPFTTGQLWCRRRQAIILTSDGLVWWDIYAPLGLDGLNHWSRKNMVAILPMLYSTVLSWQKIYICLMKIKVFLTPQQTTSKLLFRQRLGASNDKPSTEPVNTADILLMPW